MCDRSLMDRTQDSDSCNVGSIPAGRIAFREDKVSWRHLKILKI